MQDAQASRDFIEHDADPSPSEVDYHGTACAGIIGMARNGLCGVGVAPGINLGGMCMYEHDSKLSVELLQLLN